MSEFTKEIEAHFPTPEEVEKALAEAREMRAEMMRNAMHGMWAMLQRSVTRKGAPRTA